MTLGSSDRLNKIEALLEETAQVTRSNSKTIQAILDTQVEARFEREELRESAVRTDAAIARIDDAIQRLTTLNEGVVKLLASLDDDRPTILGRLSRIENKVDQLLSRDDGGQPQQ
jgi:predicted methyltransferase